jgi:hypothetical protein
MYVELKEACFPRGIYADSQKSFDDIAALNKGWQNLKRQDRNEEQVNEAEMEDIYQPVLQRCRNDR